MTEERDLIEAAAPRALAAGRIDRGAGVIREVVLMTAVSANGPHGRLYKEDALRAVARLAEGLPAYANHVDKSVAFKPRDVREIIGRHRNVRYDASGARVLGDFHVLPEHSWVFGLAEHAPDVVGFSPVSRALVRVDSTGRELVDDVVAVRSVDLVSDPATTKGLFESKEGKTMREQTLHEHMHERLRCAIHGEQFLDIASMRPTAREVRVAEQREQRLREQHEPAEVPAGAHALLFEAVTGKAPRPSDADAHARLRRALGGRR
jgi:hypothetical protein